VNSSDPVFVDLHGIGNGPDLDPVWKRCWMGKEPLWRVFWGWFVCGHGTILGCSVGFMVLAMLLGFVVSPGSLSSGIAGMATGAVLLVLAAVPYTIWSSVSVWRCAYNCIDQRWGHVVRGVILIYGVMISIPLGSKFIF
jgi:hypothetical protein